MRTQRRTGMRDAPGKSGSGETPRSPLRLPAFAPRSSRVFPDVCRGTTGQPVLVGHPRTTGAAPAPLLDEDPAAGRDALPDEGEPPAGRGPLPREDGGA